MSRFSTTFLTSAIILATGCGHTAPFSAEDLKQPGEFTDLVPRRLTYSTGADIQPQWTADGSALMYTFERQRPDDEFPDRCLGALPPEGGARIGEWCWGSFDEEARRDGVEWGMLSSDGRVVFNHHFGAGLKQPTPVGGTFYHGPAVTEELAQPEPLLELLTTPPGGSESYDYILAPVFTGPETVTALAGAVRIYEANCPTCFWDTVYTGLDLVRFSLQTAGPPEVLARILGASYLSWDPSVDRFFFGRGDRIESVATGGGAASLIWQLPRSPDRGIPVLTGVAAGGGRVAVTWQYRLGGVLHSILGMVRPDGGLEEIVHSVAGPRWGKLSLSPDGTHLAVERTEVAERDIYLWILPD